ncbi:MAG TPA: TetR/AcrR family transcriptional regulator [Amycolatopsis sp.]|jgi:AcrR family transcriptional regulator|nr:TetR/AcrR family transcriptional regulator [Amycolatopsis sp.]
MGYRVDVAGEQEKRARSSSGRQSLSAGDWVDIALVALGEGGLAAVAIEPLAKRLGATKGSFYWHFANREALIDAALARWERLNTERVIVAVEASSSEPVAENRLRRLFKEVPAAGGGDDVEVALLAEARHPQVSAALRRVAERRISYVTQVFVDLGFSHAEAQRRGLLSYTFHTGQISLLHADPDALPRTRQDRRHYLDTLIHTLLRAD